MADNDVFNTQGGVVVKYSSSLTLAGNTLRDHTACPALTWDRSSRVNVSLFETNSFLRNRQDADGVDLDALPAEEAREAAERAKITAWWAIQTASRTDFVREPDAFDVTVAPGDPLHPAVQSCPVGGSILLLPGVHSGFMGLDKSIRIFGRGAAEISYSGSTHIILSIAEDVVLDGIIFRLVPNSHYLNPTTEDLAVGLAKREFSRSACVDVVGGRLRLQACDIAQTLGDAVHVTNRAEVEVIACKCAGAGGGEGQAYHLRSLLPLNARAPLLPTLPRH